MATWVEDKNGNKCSVEYFGSQEAAQKALDSLKGCSDCSDCYGCSGCSGCSGCYYCSRCSDCYGCSDCYYCYGLRDKKENTGDFKPPAIPVIPEIHKQIYAAVTAPQNTLDMSDWHTCETTHCRGGWVVTLAGEEGKKLEAFHGTLLAAQLIYDASDQGKRFNPCRFFATNEKALADMKKLAEA